MPLRLFVDVQIADRRVFIAEGKGGQQRVVPVANRFFDALGGDLHDERPDGLDTERVFVALKGPRRGQPLSAEGLDEIRDSAHLQRPTPSSGPARFAFLLGISDGEELGEATS